VFADLWGYPLAGCEYQDLGLGVVRIREERRAYALLGSEIEVSGGSSYNKGHHESFCLK
jgi:hypothetical protein